MFIDFREKGRERETLMWEKNINPLPPIRTPTGDWTCNLGMCPDQDSDPWSFGVWDDASTNWATLPGPDHILNTLRKFAQTLRECFPKVKGPFKKYIFYGLCYYNCPISLLYFPLPCTPLPLSCTSAFPPPLVHVHGSYIEVLWLPHFLYYS